MVARERNAWSAYSAASYRRSAFFVLGKGCAQGIHRDPSYEACEGEPTDTASRSGYPNNSLAESNKSDSPVLINSPASGATERALPTELGAPRSYEGERWKEDGQ